MINNRLSLFVQYLLLWVLIAGAFDSFGQCGAPLVGGDETGLCEGASRNLDVLGAPGGSTVYWKKNGTLLSQTGSGITITGPGTYTAYYVSGGCTSPESFPKTIPPGSNCGGGCSTNAPSISGSGSVCPGQTVQLTASGCSGTVNWNNGASGTAISVGAGTYSATCTASGCTSGNSGTITIGTGSNCQGGGTNAANLGQFVGVNMTNTGQQLAGIGQFNLAVNGKIIANEIRVRTGWADYVFDPSYRLRTLSNVERFIKVNRHLPDVLPETVVNQNGISIGESNAVLLRKIEELTLYIIQQEKRIRRLEGTHRRKKS